MHQHSSEKGQALILITLAAIGIFAFAALAIDGSMKYSDRRHAQNAADTAALSAALAYARNIDLYGSDPNPYARVQTTVEKAALDRTTDNGYDSGTENDVTIVAVDVPADTCPSGVGKDFIVTITSYVDTTFARVIGRYQMTNTVTATSRVCGRYHGPLFPGNAIVSLAPSGTGFDANGNTSWDITGGGIFANSSDAEAAHCQSNAAEIVVPSVTVVGNVSWGNCTMSISGSTDTDATQLSYSDYSSLFPPEPACNGMAQYYDGQWHPAPGANGSWATFTQYSNPDFAPGVYCISDDPGSYHGTITGTGVTFFIPATNSGFNIKFNGGGNLDASAPTSGIYKGVLMYVEPTFDINGNLIQNTSQEIELRGNGTGSTVGTIIAPSTEVTMFGNSSTDAYQSQIIAWLVDAGGGSEIFVSYDANENYSADVPNSLTLLE